MAKVIIRDTAAEFPTAAEALGARLFEGDMAIDLATSHLYYWDGSAWTLLSGGSGTAFWKVMSVESLGF